MMIIPNVEPIISIVELVAYTGGLKGHNPISILVCAPTGHGKTQWVMKRFEKNRGIHRAEMLTRIGIAKWLFKPGDEHWQGLHHLIIADATTVLGGTDVNENLEGYLQSLNYEGTSGYHSLHLPSVNLPHPVTIGLIAGLVPATIRRRGKRWAETGFLRRYLPTSYSYTQEQLKNLMELTLRGRTPPPPPRWINYRLWNVEVTIKEELALPLIPIVASLNGDHTLAEMLFSLVLAHALRRGVLIADGQDVAAVIRLSQWMNYDCLHLPNQIIELE